MRGWHSKFIIILFIFTWLVTPSMTTGQPPADPVVRAVLFYSPSCPHCHEVITEVLLPMVEDYGSEQLQIIGIDTTQPAGGTVYQSTIERYAIPTHRRGVPTLVVGNVVLVGSIEIPETFPGMVEEGLAKGGIDWPDIPGLEQVIPPDAQEKPTPTTELQPTDTPAPTATNEPSALSSAPLVTDTTTQTPPPAPQSTSSALTLNEGELPAVETEEPSPDPVGFTLASVVLLGMVAAIVYVVWRVITNWQRLLQLDDVPSISAASSAIPLLALLGLGVAIYLAYVEINQVEAVCGPVGECNIVQSSPYAQILGIPIAVLGVLNYVAIIVLWVAQRLLRGRWAKLSALGLLGLTLFGALFSIYLTCLELFVIHAICAWCLSSAVITTLLMLLASMPTTSKES